MQFSRPHPPLSLTGVFFILAFVWALGFPKPMYDDLFFSGAAFNLASGGDLSNPLLARQGLPGHFYFAHPPFYSYALAGWLKVFGLNSAAVTGFQIGMYGIIATATILVLRRRGVPPILEWIVPLCVCVGLRTTGLRAEPFAIALILAGFSVFELGYDGLVNAGTAYLLMFLGALTAERTLAVSVALIVYTSLRRLPSGPFSWAKAWRFALPLCLAAAATSIAFLGLISFRLSEFWEEFRLCAQVVQGNKLVLLREYLHHTFWGATQYPLLLSFLVITGLAFRSPLDAAKRLALWLSGALVITALLGLLGHGAIWWLFLVLLLLAGSVMRSLATRWQGVLVAILSVTLLLANSNASDLIYVCGVLKGDVRLSTNRDDPRLILPVESQHAVLLDSSSARYLFDYRIPKGYLDWQFGAKFPGNNPLGDFRPEDIYLVGAGSYDLILRSTYLTSPPAERSMPLGLARWQTEKYPCRVFLVSAADCKGVRPDRPPY